MDVVLLGPPGAGKGTQAEFLSGLLNVPRFSTGDAMRAERSAGTELGNRFNEYMARGELVPDEMVHELVVGRMSKADAARGLLFDGYPRTVPQAQALDAALKERGRRVDHAIAIEVPLEQIVERLGQRRVCAQCGHVYHLIHSPPPPDGKCVQCGASKIVQRDDDKPDVIRNRYQEYLAKTQPLIEYYRRSGVLSAVHGVGSVEEVTSRLRAAVGVP